MRHAAAVMTHHGVVVDTLHALDQRIASGMSPDDILVLGTPIWLGVKSSVCTQIVERLYSNSTDQNDRGQYVYYGKVGGCLVTGNEDGVKAVAMEVL
ncbi:MAG: hypothetical protein ABIQ60_10660 [Burkholderiaceae bacterium]